ncbi:MAG: hypothetical protein R3E89_18550 [Thiolinea sp.]
MTVAIDEKIHTKLGSRLNYEDSGMSSLFRKLTRQVKKMEGPPYREQFVQGGRTLGRSVPGN